jgi:osmotically-inducible protein OsmY
VVTLNGLVKSYAEKIAAEKDARRVFGVQAIAEEIKVRYPSDAKTSDTEIAKRIVDLFVWNVLVPEHHIKVKIEHGWVTLTGRVDFGYQRDAAKRAAGQINGVVGISDLVELRYTPVAATVRERVKAAIKRQADRDAETVGVGPHRGQVDHTRPVCRGGGRMMAAKAAGSCPGVTKVVDHIAIAA